MPRDTENFTDTSAPLSSFSVGMPIRITAYLGNATQQRRLMELGLPLGSIVHISQHKGQAGLVVARNECRLALSHSIAQAIQAKALN